MGLFSSSPKKASKKKHTIFYKLYHLEQGKQVINYMGSDYTCYSETKKEAQDNFIKAVGNRKFKIEGIEPAHSNKKVDTKVLV